MKKIVFSILFVIFYSITFSQITLTSTVTNVTCYGLSNGSATVSATGGAGVYTYTWLPSGTASPNTLTNVSAGNYTVIVEDAVANTNSLVVTILEPSQLNAIAVVQNSATCWCNGSASVTATGGNPPYNYIWNNPGLANTSQVTNLCPGITQVSITDINGCVAITTVAIIPTSPPVTIAISPTNTSCQHSCDGAASATVSGGTPAYSYTWSGPSIASGQNTPNAIGLCIGNYTIYVTDATGCISGSMISIGFPTNNSIPNTTVTSTSYNETCHLTGDGAIDISITGSNPGPFTYLWSNGVTTQDLNNIPSNIYWVTISDGNANCMTIQDTITSIGTNCGTISGNAFIDINSDCIKNTGDNNLTCASIIVNPGNRIGYANSAGDYLVSNLPYGTYSVSLNNNYGALIPTCTQTIITNVNSGNQNSINNHLSVDFSSSTNPDLTVSAYSNGIVPGFVCYVYYNLSNLNNVSATGLFKAVLPSAFIANITAGNPSTYSISGDTVIWNFSNITYSGGGQSFQINFTTPLSTALGSSFISCMWAQPTVTDLDYTNNTYFYSRYVTGSFDPNDKTVSPVGFGPYNEIHPYETDLTYLIRFQNTGNGPAVNIVVKDTLSPNVDVNTFEMLGSSHNYNIEILPGNILKWKFNNIMLPDSNSNEPGSHGYIQYRIKHTVGNLPGTQIKNTAYIYFDFNEPVVTNTALNTIEYVTSISAQSNSNDGWNVYPNPSTGALYIVNSTTVKEESHIQVLNSIGQTVFEETIHSNYKNIDLSKLNNGMYFVKITSDKNSTVKRVVLRK